MKTTNKDLKYLVKSHLDAIYTSENTQVLAERLLGIMGLEGERLEKSPHYDLWNEKDAWLITYGNSLISDTATPLKVLKNFWDDQLADTINGIHILPFFPYSSDDGFSVINYSEVNDSLGDWSDIEAIAQHCRLMSDLVINHCSSRSLWFDNFKQQRHPGKDYFIEADPEIDTSNVVRPRTSSLLREVQTLDGKRHVWCTFSHDQIDLNFSNIEVLCEFTKIIKQHIDYGVRIFRLDAVAFLWKEIGTNCIHLPQTHEMIRLLRVLIEHYCPEAILITETNVPNHENLSYFGNANEAHAIYNFSLPPLVLQALTSGSCQHLKTWQMSMPPAQLGTFYFNFLASHDGIGLRPVEGLLSEQEIGSLVNTMQQSGARISWRATNEGKDKPYEINISLYDAMERTHEGQDNYQLERFLCAHTIMLALEGIPGIYIHSLLGTQNDYHGVEASNHNRAINRHQWSIDALSEALQSENSHHRIVFERMKKRIKIRTSQPAFHPNAVQFTLHINDEVFGFWRQSIDKKQSIFCLNNVSAKEIIIPLSSINLIGLQTWSDLISGECYSDIREDITLKPYQCLWLTNKVI